MFYLEIAIWLITPYRLKNMAQDILSIIKKYANEHNYVYTEKQRPCNRRWTIHPEI